MFFPRSGVIPVEWYFTDKPPLKYPTRYNSRNWLTDGIRDVSSPGEIEGSRRQWTNGRGPFGECTVPKGSADAWAGKSTPLIKCVPVPLTKGGVKVGGFAVHHQGDEWESQGGGLLIDGAGSFGTGWPGSGGLLIDGAGSFGTGWPGSGGLVMDGEGDFSTTWLGSGGLVMDGEGDFSTGMDDVPTGAIYWWGNATPPAGHLVCDGSSVSQATYAALFAVIGTTFGNAGGAGTFDLPDLRGRHPIGAGTGPGLSARALAATGGQEAHVLTVAEIPAHTHPQDVKTVIAPGVAGLPAGDSLFTFWTTGGTTQATGGGGGHETMGPWLCLIPIIKT